MGMYSIDVQQAYKFMVMGLPMKDTHVSAFNYEHGVNKKSWQ